MASFRLSQRARHDIAGITRHSARQWGTARGKAYVAHPEATFSRLAEFPLLGRDVSFLRPGYRQMETARHTVFYRTTEGGILIIRVLHQSMLPNLHL